MKENRWTVLVSALLAMWAAAGCGSDAGGPGPDPDPFVSPSVAATLDVSAFSESRGLAWDGTHLWALARDTQDRTYKIYRLTTSGEILNAFAAPLEESTHQPAGLAWDGASLWTGDSQGRRIYKLTTSGQLVTSFPTPQGIMPTGITWHESFLWVSTSTREIHKLTASGTQVSSMRAPGHFPSGLARIGQDLFNADQRNTIYKLDAAGSITGSFAMGGGACGEAVASMNLTGLAWDGEFLWSSNLDTNHIYKIDLGNLADAN